MKPEPVNKNIVCSCCGLDWADHKAVREFMGAPVELGDPLICVGLLRIALEKAAHPRIYSNYSNALSSIDPGVWAYAP